MTYARRIEDAGADALELNLYHVSTDPRRSASDMEARDLDRIAAVRSSIRIPLAVKLSPFYSAFANFASAATGAGADGLVLFNRFYQPDLDLETIEVVPRLELSQPWEMRLPVRWIAILRPQLDPDVSLTATSGAHSGADIAKGLLVGADVVMMTSALLRHGPDHVATVETELRDWMLEHAYASASELRGSASAATVDDPSRFERANYVATLHSWRRHIADEGSNHIRTSNVQPRRERRRAERAGRQDLLRWRRPSRSFGVGSPTILGLVGGLLVVVLAIVPGTRTAPPAAESAPIAVAHVPASLASEGFVLGRSDTPVTIDLYEDFQCPACESWTRTVFPSLAADELNSGTVRLVFHDMAFLGAESTSAGRAAYAAAQQGRFWDMWATLYANQGGENSGAFSRDRLVTMADRLGLDRSRFEADMDSTAAQAAIEASRSDAARAGVTSTPTLIVDGDVLVGLHPYTDLAAAIVAAAR